jgi:hypothetical protein
MREWFARTVLARPWAAFLVMGLACFAFGVGTVNLFLLPEGTLRLLGNHGWQAAMDGARQQPTELLLSGYAAMAAYAVFKSCEHSLVRDLTRDRTDTPAPAGGSHGPATSHSGIDAGAGRPGP